MLNRKTESEETMPVPTNYMPLLIHLDEACIEGNDWVKLDDQWPYHWRTSLMKAGLIEKRGNTIKAEYRVTEAGTLAVVEGQMPVVPLDAELTVISVPASDIRPYTLPSPVPTMADEPVVAPEPEHCGGCTETCVYREVIDLLAAKNPKVRELVEAMQTVQRLRGEL